MAKVDMDESYCGFKRVEWFIKRYENPYERYLAISKYLESTNKIPRALATELIDEMCDYTFKRCGLDPRKDVLSERINFLFDKGQ